jgi:ABC-2 type transport system ATP-binding protein
MIEARGLTKRFGSVVAVDGLTFDVEPGRVTGFLGPNGSGKSTTMAMIMGLDRPNAGSVTIDGKNYRDLRWPLREVGGLLEANAIHPGRSARLHLWSLAQYNAIRKGRVDEVLDLVGLTDVANKRVGKFSLGMGQRLGIAAALLGDPAVVLLDEPVNGLDPEGIRWMRTLCKSLASEGRTVFISSHLMAEMAQTADQLVVIGKGRLIAEMAVADFVARSSTQSFRVRVASPEPFITAVESSGGATSANNDGTLIITGMDAKAIGDLALSKRIAVYELTAQASLEDAFMEMTSDAVEYRGAK